MIAGCLSAVGHIIVISVELYDENNESSVRILEKFLGFYLEL